MHGEDGDGRDQGAREADVPADAARLVDERRRVLNPSDAVEHRPLRGKRQRARGGAGERDRRVSDECNRRAERPEWPVVDRAIEICERGLDEQERCPRREQQHRRSGGSGDEAGRKDLVQRRRDGFMLVNTLQVAPRFELLELCGRGDGDSGRGRRLCGWPDRICRSRRYRIGYVHRPAVRVRARCPRVARERHARRPTEHARRPPCGRPEQRARHDYTVRVEWCGAFPTL